MVKGATNPENCMRVIAQERKKKKIEKNNILNAESPCMKIEMIRLWN